jgi:hypothetical protein
MIFNKKISRFQPLRMLHLIDNLCDSGNVSAIFPQEKAGILHMKPYILVIIQS